MNQLQELKFEGQAVRMEVDENGEPWWVGADVCRALGLTNTGEAYKRLEEKDMRAISSNDGGYVFINEPGLYALIFSSRKEEAARFKQWVYEVLRTIRKTGNYISKPMTTLEMLALSVKTAQEHELRLVHQDKKITALDQKIDTKFTQLESRFKAEKINQFPEGCATLKEIGEKWFPHMSLANVSQLLAHLNHPTREYKLQTKDNEVRTTMVYEVTGLQECFFRLAREAIFEKTTIKNHIYHHPVIGRFYVKNISHQKSMLDLT